ncbi:DUF2970 domain-containing protein [Uliginosibacterium sp. sgz301328]|uniref:DUF2970 domain-containing protein n=1 Tax=Uliginosibacterium sp. sgz301328 TaxID=3243764 RepID=UPI00359D59DD
MSEQHDRPPGLLATIRAVLWSFAGIRRKSDYQRDAAQLKPLHVIIAGIVGGVVFVLVIVAVVKLVVMNAAS